MTRFAYEKLRPRSEGLAGDGSTGGPPSWWETLEKPGTIKCAGCTEGFETTGEEMRSRPIHLCPRCRLDKVENAERDGVPDASSLSDDDLIAAMEVVAKFQKRRERAEAELAEAEAEGKAGTADVKRRRVERLEARQAAAIERVAA